MERPEAERPKGSGFGRDPVVATCILAVFLGGIAFGVWATTAQLAQGITANGVLIVEDRRRTIQHLEGGIVEEISVREGDRINADQLAMVISDAGSAARFSQVETEKMRILAELDLYSAQLNGDDVLTFPRLNAASGPSEQVTQLIALSRSQFIDQQASLAGQRGLVSASIARLEAQAQAIDVRRIGKQREINTLRDEAEVQGEALNQRLGNISRVNEISRFLAIAETELSNLDEEEYVILLSIEEAKLELQQIDLEHRAVLTEKISEAAGRLESISYELEALVDQRLRRRVLAPVDGVVIDLVYTAQGAVVAPGDRLFDIVPSAAKFQVEVRFSPRDRDDLFVGRDVNLRFGTLDPINPPQITGVLETIAADASLDQNNNTYHYLATVTIAPDMIASLDAYSISPGIPIEVFFDKGTPRTPISYFVEPVAEMLRLGFRS